MSMIEKLARAMEVRRRELIGQPLARIWEALAETAIEAMREPTEEMISAGDVECEDKGMGLGRAELIYVAMIDAALQESKETEG